MLILAQLISAPRTTPLAIQKTQSVTPGTLFFAAFLSAFCNSCIKLPPLPPPKIVMQAARTCQPGAATMIKGRPRQMGCVRQ